MSDTRAGDSPDLLTVEAVEQLVADFRRLWDDAARRLGYRDAWEILVAALDDYGMTSWMLWDLYRDGTLAACRRLVDTRTDVLSVVTVLRKLKRLAPEITFDVLLATRTGSGTSVTQIAPQVSIRDIPDDETIDRELRRNVENALHHLREVNESKHDHLTKRAVQQDIDDLSRDHERVIQLAHDITAHRHRDGARTSVTQDDVDALLHHVLDVIARWVGLLEGTDLRGRSTDVPEIKAMAKALELFDWEQYQGAVEERDLALGPQVSDADRQRLLDKVQIHYVWDDD